jgi:hypothetical protein
MALFFHQLRQLVPQLTNGARVDNAIIGPRTSDTLRRLLKSAPELLGDLRPWKDITQTLNSVRLILATPTAMDEVLVSTNDVPLHKFNEPRAAVACALAGKIFRSVTNFACTDTLIASEAIDELKLRGIDPVSHTNQHIVLLSEWDTFFSRVSGIAFAAELMKRLTNAPKGCAGRAEVSNALQFVTQTHTRSNPWPSMLHRFIYLQGLDGEAAKDAVGASDSDSKKDNRRQRPENVTDIARWTPDVNKAEGPAQLDYLTRLADVLEEMNRNLWHQDGGRIAAVGIVGSDVYDTLLILQALRSRLPDVVFFTTDLDARYSDPHELKWSRNLLVFSGYGLRLRADLQNGVAPFRDSAQCAQYLSTLNALGSANLTGAEKILPRRFEIGRRGPVNLSIVDGGVHPPIRTPPGSLLSWWAAAFGLLAIAGLTLWKRARQMAFPSDEYRSQPLAVGEEDLGGTEGLRRIVRNLESRRAANNDKLAAWLLEEGESQGAASDAFVAKDINDSPSFLAKLKQSSNPLWKHVVSQSQVLPARVDAYTPPQPVSDSLQADVLAELNKILQQPQPIFNGKQIQQSNCWRSETRALLGQSPKTPPFVRLNRMLLEDAFSCDLVRRADEDRLQQRFKSLIAKFNALVFLTPGRWPEDPDVAKGDLLDTQPGRAWAASAANARTGRHLTAAEARANRQAVNDILIKLSRASDTAETEQPVSSSESACDIALLQYHRRNLRPLWFWLTALLFAAGSLAFTYFAKQDTFNTRTGEPFNLVGTSAWPAEFVRWSVLALSMLIIIRTQLRLGESILQITRRYRLQSKPGDCWRERWLFKLPEPPPTEYELDANKLWTNYQRIRHWFPRLLRVLICVGVYLIFGYILFHLTTPPSSPVRGQTLLALDRPLLIGSVVAFLAVTFWIIDAARCCAWFIRRLSLAPTQYPSATLEHFTQQRAIEDPSLVEEWIDLQLIADLTEPVGRLVYWPFLAVLLLLVARNPWWDHWAWHWPLLVIFGLNLMLAAASSIILQNAARDARKTGVQRLKAKLHEKQRKSATLVEHESDQAESLLEEIKNLRRGAFAPLSKNPLVGALLLNSSGVVLLEFFAQLYLK